MNAVEFAIYAIKVFNIIEAGFYGNCEVIPGPDNSLLLTYPESNVAAQISPENENIVLMDMSGVHDSLTVAFVLDEDGDPEADMILEIMGWRTPLYARRLDVFKAVVGAEFDFDDPPSE